MRFAGVRGPGRALRLVALLVVVSTGAARADIRGYPPDARGDVGPIEIDRRWWIDVGTSSPARTGHTSFFQTGLLVGGGVEFPVARQTVVDVALRSSIWPIRGSSAYLDTLNGGSTYFLGAAVGFRNHLVFVPTAFAMTFGLEAGPGLLHFGKVDQRLGGASQSLPAENEVGTLLAISLGFEYRNPEAVGVLFRFDEDWLNGSGIWSWSNVELGLTRAW